MGKVRAKYTTKTKSICSERSDLATLLPETCHITNRRDGRFRQFIVQRETVGAGAGGGRNRKRTGCWANQKIIHIELPQQPQQNPHTHTHTNSNEKLSNESALQFQICSANYYKSFVCWTTYSSSNLHTHTHTEIHWVWHTNATIISVSVPPAHRHT